MKLLKAMTTVLIRQTKEAMGEIMMPIGAILVIFGNIYFTSYVLKLTIEETCELLMGLFVFLMFAFMFVASIKGFITEVTKEYRRKL